MDSGESSVKLVSGWTFLFILKYFIIYHTQGERAEPEPKTKYFSKTLKTNTVIWQAFQTPDRTSAEYVFSRVDIFPNPSNTRKLL